MFRKVTFAILVILLLLSACSGDVQRTINEDEQIFNIMVDAEKEGRALTEEETEMINDFYLFKPLEKRGTDLDYTLNMMFNTFGTSDFNEYKEIASNELDKQK